MVMTSVALPLVSIILWRGPLGWGDGRVLSPWPGLEVTCWVPGEPHCDLASSEATGRGVSPVTTLQTGAASHLPAAAFLGCVGKA